MGSRPPLAERWVKQIFARFALIWPDQWPRVLHLAHAAPDQPNEALFVAEWAQGLAGFTGAEIAHGIERASKSCHWPPSIARFRELAIDGATREQRAFYARAAAADAEHALPTKTWAETRESGRRHLRELKAALRGGPREPTT
jgi:hypothetical protein